MTLIAVPCASFADRLPSGSLILDDQEMFFRRCDSLSTYRTPPGRTTRVSRRTFALDRGRLPLPAPQFRGSCAVHRYVRTALCPARRSRGSDRGTGGFDSEVHP